MNGANKPYTGELYLDRHFALRSVGAPTAERLLAWQADRLAQTLENTAQNAMFYRNRLDRSALKAARNLAASGSASAGGLNDILRQLPFTRPEDIISGPERFLAVEHDEVEGIISLPTSGTTGGGKRVFCNAADLRETAAFFRHGMRFLLDMTREERVVLLMSGTRPGSVGDLLGQAMRSLNEDSEAGISFSVHGFLRDLDNDAEELLKIKPTCLVGLPRQLLALARHERAGELGKTLRSVLLSGDVATPALREEIAGAFSCPVFVHYGLTETGLGGAVECRARSSCHLREADMLFEIIGADDKPSPDGNWGEITITTLTREAMPLLRYRTGDAGRIAPEPCPCGSIFRRLEVGGRLAPDWRNFAGKPAARFCPLPVYQPLKGG